MSDDPYFDDPNEDAYEDYEEYVDFDEHERARADARRRAAREAQNRERHEDVLDEYHYGEMSGEDFEDDGE